MAITGEWYSQNARPILKSENAVSQDIATCDLAGGAVISEKASSNLRNRSIILSLQAATSTEEAGQVSPCSSANMVWTPRVPVNILAVYRYATGLEEMATCDNFVLYGAGGACAAGILLKDGTTDPPRYSRTAATLYTVNHAANTVFLLRRFSSTCSVQSQSLFQVDYETSG